MTTHVISETVMFVIITKSIQNDNINKTECHIK